MTSYNVKITQTGCGRSCVSKPPSRKTYEGSPTGIKVETRQLQQNPLVSLYSIWPFWAEPSSPQSIYHPGSQQSRWPTA